MRDYRGTRRGLHSVLLVGRNGREPEQDGAAEDAVVRRELQQALEGVTHLPGSRHRLLLIQSVLQPRVGESKWEGELLKHISENLALCVGRKELFGRFSYRHSLPLFTLCIHG